MQTCLRLSHEYLDTQKKAVKFIQSSFTCSKSKRETTIQLTFSELWLMFWQASLKVKNKHSSSDFNIMFVQSSVVFNNDYTVYIDHGMFSVKCFSWMLMYFFFYVTTCFRMSREQCPPNVYKIFHNQENKSF